MPRIVAIIPARLGSTRLPRKVLLADTGKPLLQHVWEQAKGASRPERIIIATDAREVLDACAAFGAEAIPTSEDHPNGTSRLAEAAGALGLSGDDIAVNVQGDEPELEGSAIDAAIEALLSDASAHVGTTATPLEPRSLLTDPAIVKVTLRLDGSALYFSRGGIPHDRDGDAPPESRPLRHLGVYAYRVRTLRDYLRLAPTPLEQCEKLEQLRLLEHGYRISVAVAPSDSPGGIDTRAQYDAFVQRWRVANG